MRVSIQCLLQNVRYHMTQRNSTYGVMCATLGNAMARVALHTLPRYDLFYGIYMVIFVYVILLPVSNYFT